MTGASSAATGVSPRSNQRGVVLFIALIVLVAMTLAGLAMFRQVGTGIIIAGNLAFKDNATSVSDLGIETGRAWLVGQSSGTLQSDVASGYCSSWQPNFDPTTHGWTGAANCAAGVGMPSSGSVQVTADDGTGNEVRYVVHRLCRCTGALNAVCPDGQPQECSTLGSAGAGGSKGGGQYGVLPLANTMQPYFRITVRTAGPRNTVSYVQAVMY